jgi:fatty acid desaturase
VNETEEDRAATEATAPEPPRPPREPRPIIERIGLAAVALILALLFGGVAAASWIGGELFLAIMGAIGCLMTLWVGGLTLVRG